MLSIKPIGSSKQEVSYYAELGSDYYNNESEPPGTWWGSGAKSLGLSGTVDATTFRNLLTGISNDGTKLVQNAGDKNRRAAFDLTFSAVKSVSTLWSQCDLHGRKQIEAASERALYKTLAAFDDLCGVTRRGKLGQRIEKAGLVAAVFRHETSRGIPGQTPDPNLHFHVVLANVAVRADGTTGAYDARSLFRRHMKMALGAMFRTQLSKELSTLGLESYRPTRAGGRQASWFELRGVPQTLIEAFSKRRQEIEKWLRAKGRTGAKAAEQAALKTRHNKEKTTRQQLFTSWRQAGQEHGFTKFIINTLFNRNHHQAPATPQTELANAQQAVKEAVKQITDSRAHFSKLELLRFSAEASQCLGVGISTLRVAVTDALESSQQIVQLKNIDGETSYTTQEMLDIESAMLDGVAQLATNSKHQISAQIIANTLTQHETLCREQAEAIRHITTNTGAIACVNGMAGTGKTFMLNIARQAWESAGLEVIGTALASTAAKGLEEGSAIESTHIHKLLYDIENGHRQLNEKTVLVVDEAGMVGTRQMEQLVSLANRSNSKLVLVGDHKQLQAISAGAPFRGIAERVGVAELTEIIRQREKWARTAVTEFSQGQSETALQRFADRGLLQIANDRDEAMEYLADDWQARAHQFKPDQLLIFAGTNVEATTLNRICQQRRKSAGELGDQSLAVGRDTYYEGDRVIFTRNNAALLVRNGSTGTIESIDRKLATLRVQLDDGVSITIDTQLFENFRLGYCVTTHKGQGRTVELAFMLTGGEMTDREMAYVQGSRSRTETRIYTDVATGGTDIASLAKQMNKSRAKDLAHDHLLERR